MKTFSKNLKKRKNQALKTLIILLGLLAIVGLYIYSTSYYVIIRFNELGPLTKNMSAYYNGFKIGKIVRIGPDKDFKHTIAKVKLNQSETNLPQNTTVQVERFPNGELYLQFIYPQSPSLKKITRGDILEGSTEASMEEFMLGQNISGVTDIVSIHVLRALNATEVANQEIQVFFQSTSKLVKENSEGINASVKNTEAMTKSLSQMAENLNQASKKLNDAIDETTLKDTTLNLQATTANISNATKDIGKTTQKIDDTISELNTTAKNLTSITSGVNQALGKRFGGMRVLFGTPVKSKNCE